MGIILMQKMILKQGGLGYSLSGMIISLLPDLSFIRGYLVFAAQMMGLSW